MSKTVVLCGNPNVGKSTVFNTLTGLRQHTGNWTGKTVESARGQVKCNGSSWTLIDLPGAYSLLGGSPDEMAASDFMLMESYDAAVVVCDATCLSRSMPLVMQTARICPRTVICLNLMDEAEKQNIRLDADRLSHISGLPVVKVCAKRKQGIRELTETISRIMDGESEQTVSAVGPLYPPVCQKVMAPLLEKMAPHISNSFKQEMLSLRILCGEEKQQGRITHGFLSENVYEMVGMVKRQLEIAGYPVERIREEATVADMALAEKWTAYCTESLAASIHLRRRIRADKLLCSPVIGIPLMLMLLIVLFYITMVGANTPSAWLSQLLLGLESVLADWLGRCGLPEAVVAALVHGMYRSLAWVVSVMLPPMAIFFPLFTLLEDLGYLPRIAFNLDRCFSCCHACGKQALCMCMGLGCNAVGVTGCRIIQSPRERMAAMLTNALVPCNGRLPLLLLLVTLMFAVQGKVCGNLSAALLLVCLLVLCVLVVLALTGILSRTVLRGMGSAFVLELPPFRMPAVGQVIVRSVLDRTILVLGRATLVAAPAGLVLWLLGNSSINGLSLLQYAAGWLEPVGRVMGMDGTILLAFLLGLPANEIVLPIMLMIYLQQGTLMEPAATHELAMVLRAHGWTWLTALCTALFTLFHWPCATTILTIRKESGSLRWTLAAVLLPAITGFFLCSFVAFLGRAVGLV